MADERHASGNGLIGGQTLRLSNGDQLEVKGVTNKGSGGGVHVADSESRKVQQQVQGPVVRWDRFLPFRSLKVLLVENDDCTRHVVSALLRNCSYEVVAVANGVQAWRYLEDLTNHTDLILTEVVMPLISGIGLLCKIMNHKTIKNIPVIMMSSHDSMGIVFKCLSRGAVDFLVKPIRKNELKNLWQHVWRRCQSSSGSGSESGSMSRKSVRSKSRDIPDNSNCSNGHEYGRVDSSSDEDEEYESGAQSSWTKRAAEIGSPQPTEDETNDAPDSTCAQVIHTKPQSVNDGKENVNVAEESEEQQKQFEIGPCKDHLLEQGDLQYYLSENPTLGQNKLPELDFAGKQKTKFDQSNKEIQRAESVSTAITSLNMQLEGNIIEASNGVTEFSHIDKLKLSPIENPILGLRSEKERYTCGPSLLQDSQKDRISMPLDNNSVTAETMRTNPSRSGGTPFQLANGFIDKNGGNSTPKLEVGVDELESSAPQNAGQAAHKSCTVQPVKLEKAEDITIEIQVQPRESQQVHVEHHHHYHHYHHHIHDVQHHTTLTNQDQCSFENPETAAVRCASSNAFTETGEGTAGNFSMNGSGGSGSQHGSNGKDVSQHGSNGQNVITNTNNDDGIARNSANDIVNMNIITNGLDEDRFSQREAGLIKFRQKRKERSFERKVLTLTNGLDEDRFSQREAGLIKFRQKRKERSFERKVRIQGRKKVADQQTCERYLQPNICDAKIEDDIRLDELAFSDNSSDNVQ